MRDDADAIMRYEERNGVAVTHCGDVGCSPCGGVHARRLDRRVACPLEAKHVAGREPLEIVVAGRMPRLRRQVICTCDEAYGAKGAP